MFVSKVGRETFQICGCDGNLKLENSPTDFIAWHTFIPSNKLLCVKISSQFERNHKIFPTQKQKS